MTIDALTLPIAAVGRDLLLMMIGAALLGALFVVAAMHLFPDKPARRRKKPLQPAP